MGIFNKTIPQALVGYDMIIANSYPMHSWNNYIVNYHLMQFFFLFIGREATTWPANNCLQIVVCSCSVSPNCVWLQNNNIVLMMRKCDCSCMKVANHFIYPKIFIKKTNSWSNDKNNNLSLIWLSQNIVICQCLADQLIFCLRLWLRQQLTIFCSTSSNC